LIPGLNIKTYPGILYQIISNFIINSLVHGFENKDEGEILIEISKENQIIQNMTKMVQNKTKPLSPSQLQLCKTI
jgi:two-component sensor histidine kinase